MRRAGMLLATVLVAVPAPALAQDDPTGQYIEQVPSGGKPHSSDASRSDTQGTTSPSGSTSGTPATTPPVSTTDDTTNGSGSGRTRTTTTSGAKTKTTPEEPAKTEDSAPAASGPGSETADSGDGGSGLWIAVLVGVPLAAGAAVLLGRRFRRS